MKKGYFYIFLSALIFSTMEISGKIISTQINPFQLTFVRFLIGGIILLPFAIKEMCSKNIKLDKSDWVYFLITGFLCIIVSMSFFQLAIVYTKASTVAVVFSTNPIFTVPFAYFILKEKISKKTVFSIIVSMVGLICILNPFNLSPDLRGIILSILAAITSSLYSVIGKIRINKFGGTILTCFTFIIGDLVFLIFLIIFKIPILSGINSSNILNILYLGVVVTGIGYLVYFLAIKETSVIASSIVFFIKPALAPLLSFFILNEVPSVNTILGIFFILIGALIMFIQNTKTTKI